MIRLSNLRPIHREMFFKGKRIMQSEDADDEVDTRLDGLITAIESGRQDLPSWTGFVQSSFTLGVTEQ